MITSERVVLKDKDGRIDIMCKFNKCLHRDVDPTVKGDGVHPMFIVRGKEVDAVYLPGYISSVFDGIPYSLPMQKPAVSMSFDQVVECHRRKGDRWHMMTAVEWKFLEDLINLYGREVHGNTMNGHYHADIKEQGITTKDSSVITLTGSGPDSWYTEDGKEGTADFVGDVWKRIAGFRIVNGRYQYIKDNDAAAPDCDLSFLSHEWEDVLIDGKQMKVSYDDGSIAIFSGGRNISRGFGGSSWEDVNIDLDDIPDFVKAIGIIPSNVTYNQEIFYVDTEENECVPFRGGGFNGTSNAGSSALDLSNLRFNAYGSLGFFSAYYE
jgi:hypothetical protein